MKVPLVLYRKRWFSLLVANLFVLLRQIFRLLVVKRLFPLQTYSVSLMYNLLLVRKMRESSLEVTRRHFSLFKEDFKCSLL